ncbi:gfo/Idh/MocA family oxidoreductase [Sesbania bispinosa]|nr:gfo/Idh/MocA family oxidoreductase [Sesbania bispinosa]
MPRGNEKRVGGASGGGTQPRTDSDATQMKARFGPWRLMQKVRRKNEQRVGSNDDKV